MCLPTVEIASLSTGRMMSMAVSEVVRKKFPSMFTAYIQKVVTHFRPFKGTQQRAKIHDADKSFQIRPSDYSKNCSTRCISSNRKYIMV